MDVYGKLLGEAINFMMTEFSLFGWSVSYWHIFVFECILAIIGMIVWEILH